MIAQRVVMAGPHRASLEDVEISDAPLTPGEVLLRTHYSLISPGTELAYFAGDQTLGHRADPYPFYPGYAAVGEVLATGDDVPVRKRDLMLAHTPHQSIARVDCRQLVCVPVPEGVAPDLATLARLAQVSAVSIRLMAARPGDRAAVTGLGLVGMLAAQLFRAAGMRVLGAEPLAARRKLAERCGISDTFDPSAGVGEHETTCAAVLECSGQDRGVLTALDLAACHGEVFLVGAAWKRGADVVAADIVRPVFNKFLALRSGWEWQLPLYGKRPPGSIAGCTEWVFACMREGTLRGADMITDRVAPDHAHAAYAGLLDHPAEHLGVLLDWRGGARSEG
jgi:2-desacetyl-2-hydroxyethyl bacteriochlorophyllide A dehydrogenase